MAPGPQLQAYLPEGKSLSESDGGAESPGIERCSDSQAPRSISRQRSLQKGRNGELAQSILRWQVGHLTPEGLIRCNNTTRKPRPRRFVSSVWRALSRRGNV